MRDEGKVLSAPEPRYTFTVLGPKVTFADQTLIITALLVHIASPWIAGFIPARTWDEQTRDLIVVHRPPGSEMKNGE